MHVVQVGSGYVVAGVSSAQSFEALGRTHLRRRFIPCMQARPTSWPWLSFGLLVTSLRRCGCSLASCFACSLHILFVWLILTSTFHEGLLSKQIEIHLLQSNRRLLIAGAGENWTHSMIKYSHVALLGRTERHQSRDIESLRSSCSSWPSKMVRDIPYKSGCTKTRALLLKCILQG